jgi:mono/diheme cytochrome c family protein
MLLLMALITILANVRIASGQTGKEKQVQIPENINQIFQNSCMPCHGAEGGRLPASKLNFSRWAGYGVAKEEEKASRICSAVTKETMPPKSARKLKPERIPTKEQVVLICNWAESLKSVKGEK